MRLETFALEHIPAAYSAHVALFRDLENAAFLHQQLLARNADFEYAFVDASTVSCLPRPASRPVARGLSH